MFTFRPRPFYAFVFALFLSCGLFSAASAMPIIGEAAPQFSGKDSSGMTHNLDQYRGKIVILEWVNFECPFIRKHYDSGNMQKLQEMATNKGVVWLSIASSAPGKQGHLTAETASEALGREQSYATAMILDESGTIGQLYDAKTTPHMFVIDTEGKIAYMGAIDDKPSFKQEDIETATNYVSAALDALWAGNPPEITSTTPYGCAVKY